MAGIRKIIGDNGAQHRHLRRDMRSDQHTIMRHKKIPQSWKDLKRYFRDVYVPMYYADILFNKLQCLKQDTRTVTSYYHICMLVYYVVLACHAEKQIEDVNKKQVVDEERDMKEPSVPLFTFKVEAPPSSEEGIKGKLNGAEINQEQPLVEPTAEIPLSQVDLFAVPCDKEELCDNASLISMPQLVNEHAISSVSLCADFKHVVHIANDIEERKLITSFNTLGYVQFDDFCELNNLEEKLFAKSDLPCPTNAIFYIFGEYNDRGIYLVHRVFICSDLEKHIIANHTTSSFSSFDWMKQVILNGLCEEHHMKKPRTVFREEGEDDVTIATTDTNIAHIMDEQEDIKIKASKCWNPIRPPAALLSSNGHQISIRAPFSAREYLMESSRSPSNGSSLISKFHLIEPQLKQQGAASPVMGLCACNFVWDPGPKWGPCGVRPKLVEHDPRTLLVVLPHS
uniref:Retrotransposon, putative, centromere-specific n=1 Tax=Oryza sativa subsp. japonica TaxID=39947 RepID=Q339X6_ORYSJ|nr:retrotransposon, putative, centromere-specific [Oryza sativa Japonica Group]